MATNYQLGVCTLSATYDGVIVRVVAGIVWLLWAYVCIYELGM